MKTIRESVLATAVATVVLAVAAWAGKPAPPVSDTPAYDVAAEFTVKGTVTETKTHESTLGYTDLHLLIATEKGNFEVHVAPLLFVQKKGFEFAKGDVISVTGARAVVEGLAVFVAREIRKGSRTLTVRDFVGRPVWPKKLRA